MTYNQIKHLLVPPAKRTAQTVQKWVAKMPQLPQWPYLAGKITLALLTSQLTFLLIAGIVHPGIPLSYGVLYASIMVMLAAYEVYQGKDAIAKAMVLILASL